MSDVPSVRLPFGTVAALFESPQAADRAADRLVQRGYPPALVSVFTGRPWQDGEAPRTGYVPDPELRYALIPTAGSPVAPSTGDGLMSPRVAAFYGPLLSPSRRRVNPALWTVVALAIGVIAFLLALYTRDWIVTTIVGVVAAHLVVITAVLAYVRRDESGFPFREHIPEVDSTLEGGGALVTVRCTLPYTSTVGLELTEAGGQVLGYARNVVYPLPA